MICIHRFKTDNLHQIKSMYLREKNSTLKMESLWLDFFIQVSRVFVSKAMTSTGANKCNIELGSQYEITRFIWEKWIVGRVDALNPLCPPGSHQLWTPGSVKLEQTLAIRNGKSPDPLWRWEGRDWVAVSSGSPWREGRAGWQHHRSPRTLAPT